MNDVLILALAQKLASGGGGSELPSVTSSDNGKVLEVINGKWDKGSISGGSDLPDVTSSDNGKILKVINGEWGKGEESQGESDINKNDLLCGLSNSKILIDDNNMLKRIGDKVGQYMNDYYITEDYNAIINGDSDFFHPNGYVITHPIKRLTIATTDMNSLWSLCNMDKFSIYFMPDDNFEGFYCEIIQEEPSPDPPTKIEYSIYSPIQTDPTSPRLYQVKFEGITEIHIEQTVIVDIKTWCENVFPKQDILYIYGEEVYNDITGISTIEITNANPFVNDLNEYNKGIFILNVDKYKNTAHKEQEYYEIPVEIKPNLSNTGYSIIGTKMINWLATESSNWEENIDKVAIGTFFYINIAVTTNTGQLRPSNVDCSQSIIFDYELPLKFYHIPK